MTAFAVVTFLASSVAPLTIGAATAASAQLTATPTISEPGGAVTVEGQGLPANLTVVLTWDSDPQGMPLAKTTSTGEVLASLVVPLAAAAGDHRIGVASRLGGREAHGLRTLGSTVVTVGSVNGAPSPTPPLVPDPSPTDAPATASPTPTPGPGTPAPAPTPAPTAYLFGTMLTVTSHVSDEAAVGVRVAHLELGWDNYEPQDGVFSSAYASQARQRLDAFRAAGMKVVLGLGLQYPPSWVYGYPGSRYMNQYGRSADPVNLTFNQTLRAKVDDYIARVAADLGLDSFWAVRVGSGGAVETLYPAEWDGTSGNAFWAYDANAQRQSPFPGWKPGQTTWNGQPFTTLQVGQWYDWYVGALADTVDWQVATYRRNGFTGWVQVLLPGQGVRPTDWSKAVAGYLGGAGDDNRTVGRGAAWDRILDRLVDRTGLVAYVSSVADGSGGDDVCTSADALVSPVSSTVSGWSATRWISYLADRHGMVKMGENPGRADTNGYGVTMLTNAAAQMSACHFQGLMWAHDAELFSATSGVTLRDYAAVIAGS